MVALTELESDSSIEDYLDCHRNGSPSHDIQRMFMSGEAPFVDS